MDGPMPRPLDDIDRSEDVKTRTGPAWRPDWNKLDFEAKEAVVRDLKGLPERIGLFEELGCSRPCAVGLASRRI